MPSSYGAPVGAVAEPARDDPVVYGAYLAKLGHCMQCHTPIGADGKRDFAHRLGAGGLSVDISWGSRVAANITPDPETGIGGWTDEQVIAALSHGIDKDGAPLSSIMPWPYFQSMKPEDLKAIVAWLKTLKPVRNAVAR
jgi:mono/diheme cytochrome c family protein